MTDKQNFEKDIDAPSKRPPYEIALMHDHILRLEEELKAKEQECEMLRLDERTLYWHKRIFQVKRSERKLKQTLAEIKPILEFYANSKMGEEQPDRTYKIMLNGGYVMVYDPKPARQALQKISECEVGDE